MNIKQYYLGCLSHASYMISDEASKKAVLVDPQRDIDGYLKDAQDQGLTITDVVLTHFHADFVAGHLELQKRTGAAISLGEGAQAEYAFQARKDGEEIPLGKGKLRFLATPGHTPESLSLLALDEANRPQAVLTGDTLFVGDVGRPDLAVSVGHSKEDLAGQLYDSLHQKLLTLPDETVVYPAHGPGSLCGSAGLAGKVSTIGREKAENPMLAKADKAAFVEAVTSHLPELPNYFPRDAHINQIQHPTLENNLATSNRPLTHEQLQGWASQGATILDSRSPDDFAQAHLPGAVNVGIDGRFAQFAAILSDPKQPVVVVAPSGREQETITRLGRVGVDEVKGFLSQPLSEVPVVPQQRLQPGKLADKLAGENPPYVLDVRSPDEIRKGRIEGSHTIPLTQLPERWQEVPSDREVVVHCASGYRSSMAVSYLVRQGLTSVSDLQGGIQAWKDQGYPVVSS